MRVDEIGCEFDDEPEVAVEAYDAEGYKDGEAIGGEV